MMKEMITINPVSPTQIDEVVAFVREARRHLFPTLDHSIVPRDLATFVDTFIENADGTFLQARDQAGKLIGTIGMLTYDERFDDFSIYHRRVTEVVKLFVDPICRRQGLATQLVQSLSEVAASRNIETLYLHTHPFLPGAKIFWEQQGFRELLTCIHGDFETIHMAYNVSDS
ncbi:GNAT family N-acetyltransferase [Sphingobacterium chungjuense]|uniref:GNAT family N-acetyltransferase n=1 Tax=Sphingobacterium chungjuense TaxID=2675553 RepID=UPI00140CD3C0|nr:GNAT family N-acetyltransferase [Sphingobacterium chungjuense]